MAFVPYDGNWRRETRFTAVSARSMVGLSLVPLLGAREVRARESAGRITSVCNGRLWVWEYIHLSSCSTRPLRASGDRALAGCEDLLAGSHIPVRE